MTAGSQRGQGGREEIWSLVDESMGVGGYGVPDDLDTLAWKTSSCPATNIRIHAGPKLTSSSQLLRIPYTWVTLVQVVEKRATTFYGHEQAPSTS